MNILGNIIKTYSKVIELVECFGLHDQPPNSPEFTSDIQPTCPECTHEIFPESSQALLPESAQPIQTLWLEATQLLWPEPTPEVLPETTPATTEPMQTVLPEPTPVKSNNEEPQRARREQGRQLSKASVLLAIVWGVIFLVAVVQNYMKECDYHAPAYSGNLNHIQL
jgi:hypothetical protein